MAGQLLQNAFMRFFRQLWELGFRRMKPIEIAVEIAEKEYVSRTAQKPGMNYGMMRQYIYERNGVTVEILTTYYDMLGGSKPNTRAFAVVTDTRTNAKLWSMQIRRTKGFFAKFLQWANAFKDIVDNWPYDPDCGNPMTLEFIDETTNAMYFTCKARPYHKHVHRRAEIYFLDIPISDESKQFLAEAFGRNDEYIAKGGHTLRRFIISEKRISKSVP